MERIIDVAAYIMQRYKVITGKTPSEEKLQALLYLVQREYLDIHEEPLFPEEFLGYPTNKIERKT